MARETRIRFKAPKDFELVKKAAKADSRSMNQFMVLASLDRAKATLALQERITPRNRRAEDEEAAS